MSRRQQYDVAVIGAGESIKSFFISFLDHDCVNLAVADRFDSLLGFPKALLQVFDGFDKLYSRGLVIVH